MEMAFQNSSRCSIVYAKLCTVPSSRFPWASNAGRSTFSGACTVFSFAVFSSTRNGNSLSQNSKCGSLGDRLSCCRITLCNTKLGNTKCLDSEHAFFIRPKTRGYWANRYRKRTVQPLPTLSPPYFLLHSSQMSPVHCICTGKLLINNLNVVNFTKCISISLRYSYKSMHIKQYRHWFTLISQIKKTYSPYALLNLLRLNIKQM